MTLRSDIRASVSVHHPLAAEMKITRGQDGASSEGSLYLDIAPGIYICLANPGSELGFEAAAMRRLAELATELAGELDRRAAKEDAR